MRYDFNPFLDHRESFPETKTKKPLIEKKASSVTEESESEKKETKELFQPHDRRVIGGAMPLSSSAAIKYTEAPDEETLQPEQKTNEVKKIKLPKNYLHQEQTFYNGNKLEFGSNPLLRETAKLHQEAEAKAKAQENIRLFKSANIEKITDFLMDEKIIDLEFSKEVETTKKEYASQLADATFLNHKHWKILTGLRLFNKETFEHSVGTLLILKDKLHRLPKLQKEIINEGVSIEQFLLSALLHDVGKMAIPDFILNSRVSDHEWAIALAMLDENEKDEIFIKIFEDKNFSIPDSARHNPDALAAILDEKRIRAVEYVPIKTILTPEQLIRLEEFGFNGEMPLKKIMEAHEKKSEEILRKLGFVVEAALAGNHHNYEYEDKKLGAKPAALSALHIGIEISSTIIHLADVQHALSGDRPYHHKQPMLRVLAFLVDDARKGKILPGLTAAWIRDEISKMSKSYLDEVRNMSATHQDARYKQQRLDELELIEEFLEDNLDEEFSGESPSPKNNAMEFGHADNYEEQFKIAT